MTYPEDYINKIINGDCLEVMKQMPDKCVDLVLTDPPYGDNIGYGRSEKEILNNSDETINYKMLGGVYRLLKDNTNCYVFTNWKFENKLRDWIIKNTQFNIRMLLVIVKNNFGMGYGFRNQYELCIVLEKGKPVYNGNDLSNVLKMEHIQHDDNTHPHQKGIQLLQRLIKHSSQEGGVVFDPFIGSGSTAKASREINRNFIGIELDPNYHKMAVELTSQKTLF